MKRLQLILLCSSVLALMSQFSRAAESNSNVLKYDTPGTTWSEATPIGSGRLGAMMFGQPAEETFYLNEDTIWSGRPHNYTNLGCYKYLDEFRKLVLDEKYDEAKDFGAEHSLGVPKSQKAYQHLGLMHITFPGHETYSDYHRQLDMSKALVDISYISGGAKYTRQILASYPDQVIAMQLDCDKPGKIAFTARFTSQHDIYEVKKVDNKLVIAGASQENKIGDGLWFQGQLHVETKNGTVVVKDGELTVSGADSATVRFVAATNYVNYKDISADPKKRCDDYMANALKSTFDQIKKRHIADFSELFGRVSLTLDASDEDRNLTTDKLVQKCRDGKHSPLLDAQIYQFARYLTISGARPGTQPLNLVGIWAENKNAPWGGKWTLNINAELNMWPAESGNLAECHQPLLALIEDLRQTGTEVAKEHYNAKGWVAHHNTDLWRGSAPVDTAVHGLWTVGGAWLARHIYEHYDYSRDIDYLRKAYPTIKEATIFFQDFLIEKDGYLVTCPAVSFEESFRKADGTPGRLTYGPTMDNQILRDLFSNYISASEILGVDADFREKVRGMRSKLRPNQIDTKTGKIMEWAFPADKDFRGGGNSGQTAPMWGVSPGREITPHDTPEMAEACVKYLNFHIPKTFSYETEGSWVTGTRVNAWARLDRAAEAYTEIDKIASRRLWPNMMMSFYANNYFQIDGNMGTASGIAEMIMQSHRRDESGNPIIDLLPALPKAWQSGSVRGLRARGAFVVDIDWKDGKLTKAKVTSLKGTPLTVYYNGKTTCIDTEPGKEYQF